MTIRLECLITVISSYSGHFGRISQNCYDRYRKEMEHYHYHSTAFPAQTQVGEAQVGTKWLYMATDSGASTLNGYNRMDVGTYYLRIYAVLPIPKY